MIRRKLNYFSITVMLLLFLILIKDLYESNFFITVSKILTPFVYGFVIAYVLNPIIQYLERKLKFNRGLTIGILYIVLILFLALFFTKISPKLISSARNLLLELPLSLERLFMTIERNILSNLNSETADRLFESLVLKSRSRFLENVSFSSLEIGQVFSFTRAFTGALTNIIIGMVVSIYMLKDKSRFALLGKKVLYAFLESDEATSIVNFLVELNRVFSRFIVGKIIDSSIMGALCFISLKVAGAPFVLLMSVIFGLTNIVPYFGPLLGMIVISLTYIVYVPELSPILILIIVTLQQFDGFYLGPKILGGKVGLSAFWTMTTILISGGLFGVMGMLLAVPAASVMRSLLNTAIDNRLENKKIKLR